MSPSAPADRPRRPLGSQGPLVAAVGYGAMSFADFYGPATEEGSHAILRECLDLGVDHLDTSNVYGMGRSETWLGAFLAANPGARDTFVIATKGGITRDADGNRCFDNSAEHLEASLDASLQRLGSDCVDLYYVHRREADRPIEEVTEALAALVAKGKTKSIGFSEIAPSSLRRAAAIHPIAAVQSEYSLQTRAPELGLVQECERQGTALVAFSPVGRGLLTDRPPSVEKASGLDFLKVNPRFMPPNLEANLKASEPLRTLAKEMGTSAAALANAWLLAKSPCVIPIPGTRHVAHLRECADAMGLGLTEGDVARIEAALPVGWAHGDRYTAGQWVGPERYC
ncbi:MAG: aldo/keto reductase [Pseudomonadota bacterium]